MNQQLDRLVNGLLEKVNSLDPNPESESESEQQSLSEEQIDQIMQARLAKLRGERATKTDAFGNKTYEDVYDNISDEELGYYREKWLRFSPEERYQILKKGYAHCEYYRQDSKIEDTEVDDWFNECVRRRGNKEKFTSYRIFGPSIQHVSSSVGKEEGC